MWFCSPAKTGSEPETQALCQLIHQIHPAWVVSFTIRWPVLKTPATARWGSGLPGVQPAAGRQRRLETPGSFGWCADIGLPCITAEFPPISADGRRINTFRR